VTRESCPGVFVRFRAPLQLSGGVRLDEKPVRNHHLLLSTLIQIHDDDERRIQDVTFLSLLNHRSLRVMSISMIRQMMFLFLSDTAVVESQPRTTPTTTTIEEQQRTKVITEKNENN
jgi:hypothetical protein